MDEVLKLAGTMYLVGPALGAAGSKEQTATVRVNGTADPVNKARKAKIEQSASQLNVSFSLGRFANTLCQQGWAASFILADSHHGVHRITSSLSR